MQNGRYKDTLSTSVLDKRTLEETSSTIVTTEKKRVIAQGNRLENIMVLDDSRISGGTRTLLESKVETLILEDDI